MRVLLRKITQNSELDITYFSLVQKIQSSITPDHQIIIHEFYQMLQTICTSPEELLAFCDSMERLVVEKHIVCICVQHFTG